jgi:molybdate transport system substrate-binding protein
MLKKGIVMTDALRILSTGAPKGGVSGCARAFEKATGRAVGILFVTAPVLRQQVETGVAEADVIVGPKARIDAFEADGSIVPGTLTPVGSVKAGVVIRNGAAIPDLSSADSLKDAILAAQSIVYNVATSGQYIVQMMEKLGVAEAIEDRVTRVPNGAGVMLHLADSEIENEIGFGQLTEIRVHEDRGLPVRLVGALPKELENVTTYAAAVFGKAADDAGARALVAFMGSDEGRAICQASGLEF